MCKDSLSQLSCPSVDKWGVIHSIQRTYVMYYIVEIRVLDKQNCVKNDVVGGPL